MASRPLLSLLASGAVAALLAAGPGVAPAHAQTVGLQLAADQADEEQQPPPDDYDHQGAPDQGQPEVLFELNSIAAVQNRPTRPTTFQFDGPMHITQIMTYHWNNAQGSQAGEIGLRSSDGKTYGPWPAMGQPGQGGVPDAYWIVQPNMTVPAGDYEILDSDEASWSQNGDTGGAGIAKVEGYPE